MSFLDELIKAGTGTVNATISESRSNVTRKLGNLVVGALPKTNRIPGPLGGFAERIKGETVTRIVNGVMMNDTISSVQGQVTKRIGDGVRQVFDAVEIPFESQIREAMPRVFNNATAAAKQVWTDIESGEMKVGDIVAKAQEPLTLLKFNYDISVAQASITEPLSSGTAQNSTHPTPYAMDLFRLAPKHKFLFVVEFIFNGGYDFVGAGPRSKNDFAVVIKEFDRPGVKYDYDDGINFYNFRSPVVKKVTHDPLTIKFLDDRQNLSMNFFHEYMKATHPITSVEVNSAASYEDNGMNFSSALNSSSTAVLDNDLKSIFREIKVYHLYDFGAAMNVHHFTNPRIVSIEHDNWNMADSEGSSIQARFVYDGWTMELGIKIQQEQAATLGTLSNSGKYQLHPMQQQASMVSQAAPNISLGEPAEIMRASLGPNETLMTAKQLQKSATDALKASLGQNETFIKATQLPKTAIQALKASLGPNETLVKAQQLNTGAGQ